MKRIVTIVLMLVPISTLAQEQLTVFYFGASSCGPCNRPEVIKSINQIKSDFDSLYPEFKSKLVMVTIDENLETALEYLQKYENWDEISMGSRYHNELCLSILNNAEVPGLPHIIIYKDSFKDEKFGIQTIKDRKLVKTILGGEGVVNWVQNNMKLDD